ncbi:MAG: type II toxin-antitoxin system VapC family toxin [Bryobacteraceae bacterium]
MNGYLLDSDIAIELLRGRNLQLAGKLASFSRQKVSLSAVTVSELLFGAHRSRDPQRSLSLCRQFCSSFRILLLDETAAEQAADVRASLEGRGQRIGAYDVLIAGIALAHGQILVTHNTREFTRVPGLRLEDWAEGQ